jgi:hypothetical protein
MKCPSWEREILDCLNSTFMQVGYAELTGYEVTGHLLVLLVGLGRLKQAARSTTPNLSIWIGR